MAKSKNREKEEAFRKAVWLRDYGRFPGDRKLEKRNEWKKACVFWRCLKDYEQELFLETWRDTLWLCNTIDVAHIVPRSIKPGKEKYDPENAALINTLAHSCLDTYRNPLTGEPMKKEDKQYWMNRIKEQIIKNKGSEGYYGNE